MKVLVVLAAFLAITYAAPQDVAPVQIVEQEQEVNGDGSYSFSFKTEDGVSRSESGVIKQLPGDEDGEEGVSQQGSYSYTAPDGQVITLTFTADENGFNPTGDHLPTPHPEILRALEQIRASSQKK
ncbi:pupal cuticle protein 20-like [Artemia franciscana]|uniref:Uncharacterized protein n=1 Tax=Artemia franciscana TaxID=6661 RepID=A0AA88L8A0_ARTSF|nr:hypothetical protein QYM36_010692 [Artemia franciscana]